MQKQLKVLILGSGGREHALLKACLASPLSASVEVAPGNGGMASEATCHPLHPEDVDATVELARQLGVNLVIVGPEAPLALGVADALREAGFAVYGPGRDGAVLESSKVACKTFFGKYGIPTARWEAFTEVAPALAYTRDQAFPLVVKASGLAAGKGVIICETPVEAEKAIRDMLEGNAFGESGKEIVIEECLTGEEASIMLMVSGRDYRCLSPSQDHKRIGEGDTGPNTGGMGAYAPAAIVTPEVMEAVRREIIEPTLEGFASEGIDFRGTLFIGLMINKAGEPKVLEYNVRFGDPECQVLLPLMRTDPLELMWACARGELGPGEVELHDGAAIIVVLAARGYPGSYGKGDLIELPDTLPGSTHLIHAGTRLDDEGHLRAHGGRVLGVVARADTLEAAAARAYPVCEAVRWENKQYRRDIGYRQLISRT